MSLKNFFAVLLAVLLITTVITSSCSKGSKPEETLQPSDYKLSYGDSIFYLKNSPSSNIIFPTEQKAGRYTSFPEEGIDLDANTGAINVSKSETGLRYRITHTAPNGKVASTVILLAGINYVDAYFNLETGDSILNPVYNGDESKALASCYFDIGGGAAAHGCAIDQVTGKINLMQTMKNVFWGNAPQNGYKEEIEIQYSINDNSFNALQKIKILLYYYRTMNEVPDDLKQKVQEHLEQLLPPSGGPIGFPVTRLSKPRPPCVVIIGH